MIFDKSLWIKRHSLKRALHSFFNQQEYIEVDTPILVKTPAMEVHLDFFESEWIDHQKKSHPFRLRTSPELHMKQVLASGVERIYQIAASFRNYGEISPWHHPEFTMLEYYHSGISYQEFIDFFHQMFVFCWQELHNKGLVRPCALPSSPQMITVKEAFKRFADIDLIDCDKDLAEKAKAAGNHSVNSSDDFETAFFKVLIDQIEPKLADLHYVALVDYPASQAALSKVVGDVAKRFEIYYDGIELCNGFHELLDSDENKARYKEINKQRNRLKKQLLEKDEDFFAALESGIKDCCGNAVGFDRLLAVITGQKDLTKIIPFRQVYRENP